MAVNWERWARASGIALVVFAVLAFVVGGETPQVQQVVRNQEKVGRNDPCPCGSGKKYKKCHGA